MCFSLEIKVDLDEMGAIFNALNKADFESSKLSYSPLGPSKKDYLPVLLFKEDGLQIKKNIWSLTPSWSKSHPVKWGTYNARLERLNKEGQQQFIYDVPSFKDAFRKNQFCLIPIRSAIESCYWGDTAGKIVGFNQKDNSNFYIVGLWSDWVDKSSGELIETCTLLTDGPYEYYFQHGHDRSVITIDENKFEELLQNKKRGHQDSISFIRNNRVDLDWSYKIIRELKDGWQKRAPNKNEINKIEQTIWQSSIHQ
jgi:putative SOS response-associated peptidase YedK